jgi:uncharacterized protein (DUF2062 family)
MPRKILQRLLPDPRKILARRELRFLGTLLDDPFLLHLNRRSVAGACAVGLFVAFIPIPAQMLLAAALAILLRVNLVLSVVLVWITNPITMPAMFYFCYRLGAWIMGARVRAVPFEPTLEWFWSELGVIWQPFLLGCFISGLVSAGLAYGAVQLLWRLHVVRALQRRRARRACRSLEE